MAPARPAALDQPPTLDGAKAVATYFVLLYSYAYQTGDLAEWNSLSDPQCIFCASVRKNSQTERGQGHRLVGGAITVTSAEGTEVDVAKFFDMTLTLNEAPSKTVDAAGATVIATTGAELAANIIATFDGRWHIREISTKPRG